MTDIERQEFLNGFLEAVLFSETLITDNEDEQDEPLEYRFGIRDFSKESIEWAMRTCENFQRENYNDLCFLGISKIEEGRNLWFSMSGHGTGFWDFGKELKEIGDRLHKAADLISYDGVIYEREDGYISFELD